MTDALLQGGGVHLVKPGGLLRVHADFNKHPSFQLRRRLNLLLYFNVDWREEYGGHLELWNRDVSQCVQRILPIANRCVIFNTSSDSYHGHPRRAELPRRLPQKVDRALLLHGRYQRRSRPDQTRATARCGKCCRTKIRLASPPPTTNRASCAEGLHGRACKSRRP